MSHRNDFGDATVTAGATPPASNSSPSSGRSGAELTEFTQLEPGEQVGKFTVVRVIGAGGMGMVYEATDEVLHRRVALKMLHPGRGSRPSAAADLVQEARAAAALTHPNIVTVHEAGIADQGPFIAMEYIDGLTLRRWLEAEERNWRQVVHVFRQVADGLAAAHAAGLVHCDVKPENILVKGDRAWIADFGIARAMGSDGEAGVGTRAYMAPEQHDGVIDERTDQYGFAVSLFEALTGTLPNEKAPAEPKVPARLRRAVLRARERDPSQRYPNIAALAQALGPSQRAPLMAGVAIVALAGGIGLALLMRGANDESRCRNAGAAMDRAWGPSQAQLVSASFERSERSYASWYRERVIRELDNYKRQWAAARTRACRADDAAAARCLNARVEIVRAFAARLAKAADADIDKSMDDLSEVIGVGCGIGRAPRSPPSDPVAALTERTRQLGEDNPLLLPTYDGRAAQLLAEGKHAEALRLMKRTVDIGVATGQARTEAHRQRVRRLGLLELEHGRPAEAVRHLTWLEPESAVELAALGMALVQSGKLRQGADFCKRANELESDPKTRVRAFRCQGLTEMKIGSARVGATMFKSALDLADAAALSTAQRVMLKIDLGNGWSNSGRTRQAIQLLKSARPSAGAQDREYIDFYIKRWSSTR